MPAAPTPPSQSFARRHPILTGFGILAGVSLFAAYFPVSAIVTGIVVGARATGADRVALRGARTALGWMAQHRPGGRRSTPAPSPEPTPVAERRSVRERSVGVERSVAVRTPNASRRVTRSRTTGHALPSSAHHRSRPARPVASVERDVEL